MTPRAITGGAWVIAATCGALYFAARTTGAGWLMVMLCVMLAVLLIGVTSPMIVARRVRISATAPPDSTAGDSTELALTVQRAGLGVHVHALEPPGPLCAALGGPATVIVEPRRRGLVDHLVVRIRSAAPFGLVWWRRTIRVPLPQPMHVAPRRGDAPSRAAGVTIDNGVRVATAARGGELIRSVREHRSGDSLRMVHWPATARHGSLLVKEFDIPERPRLFVVVDLTGPDLAADRAAEHAMSVVCDALDAGIDVTMSTVEAEGPIVGAVSGHRDGGRRLARALGGTPARPAADAGEVVIITTEDAR